MTEADADAGGGDASRGGSIARVAVMLILGVGVPVAGLAIAWRSCSRGATSGRVEVVDSTLGAWRSTLDRCTTGQAQGFRGVELRHRGESHALVRVEVDPIDGPIVTLWPPATSGAVSKSLVVRGRDCPALTVDLRALGGGDDGDGDDRFDGKVSGTCPLPGGGRVSLDAWWRGCAG